MPAKKPTRRRKDPVATALNRLADGLTDVLSQSLERVMDTFVPIVPPTQQQNRDRDRRSPFPDSTSTPPPPNFYEILEVSESASVETITAAYKSLSSRYHPDNQETGDTNKMQALNNARDVLLDPVKRKTYDALLKRSRR